MVFVLECKHLVALGFLRGVLIIIPHLGSLLSRVLA